MEIPMDIAVPLFKEAQVVLGECYNPHLSNLQFWMLIIISIIIFECCPLSVSLSYSFVVSSSLFLLKILFPSLFPPQSRCGTHVLAHSLPAARRTHQSP